MKTHLKVKIVELRNQCQNMIGLSTESSKRIKTRTTNMIGLSLTTKSSKRIRRSNKNLELLSLIVSVGQTCKVQIRVLLTNRPW